LKVYREYAKYFPVKVRPNCEHAFYRYAVLPKNRKYENGIYSIDLGNGRIPRWFDLVYDEDRIVYYHVKNHYISPIYRMPLFRSLGYPDGLCPACEAVEENIVLAWLKEAP
jgi:hypothetical protein